MPRNITVTLQDGRTHVYNNVPDNVTPEQVTARVEQEFGGAPVNIDGGKKGGRDYPAGDSRNGPAALTVGPGAGSDVAKSTLTGLGKGAAAVTGFIGDLGEGLGAGMRAIGIPTRDTSQPLPMNVTVPAAFAGPTSATVNRDIQAVAGPYHQPETRAGRYAETIASFVPAAMFPGGAVQRTARVLVPGVASEAGGENFGAPGRVAGALLGGGATELGPTLARSGARVLNRTISSLSNGQTQLLNPATEAERRIREAFIADGGPQAAVRAAASYADSGASAPSLLDIGGGNVRRLVRASAGGGDEAHNIATTYADRVRANLQDEAAGHVRRLALNERRTAQQAGREFEENQSRLATEQYREPYAQPAVVNREMVDALQGSAGRSAIARARAAAEDTRDTQAMAELSDLEAVAAAQSGGRNEITGRFRTMQEALENLSAGSLDRVRIAMRERGRSLAQSGQNVRAGGHFDRVRDIDTALDQTPGLVPARQAYRQLQSQRDAIPLGEGVLNMPSAEYADQIAQLARVGGPPNVGSGLQIGARQAMLDAIERPAAGQTGVLNRMSSATGVERNLQATFGEGRTAQFREAIRNEVQRLRNANFVSPETGSQTQLRHLDEGLIGFPTSVRDFIGKLADKFLRGVSLTPAERAEIVRLGTSEADLRRFVTAPDAPARAGRSGVVGAEAYSATSNSQAQ